MDRVRVRNARQERWLAEAADALLQAEIVVSRADAAAGCAWRELGDLHARLALLRREVELLRSPLPPRPGDFQPEWIELSAWS